MNDSPSSATTVVRATDCTVAKSPLWKRSPADQKYFINSVAVSADGSRVVGGTFYHVYSKAEQRRAPQTPTGGLTASPTPTPSPDDGTFGTYCYDGSGNLLWSQTFAGWQGVYWVAISADGKRVAAGGLKTQTAPQGFVAAYDATNSGASLLSYATKQRVNQVALSHDGTWLIAGADTLLLFKYDSTTSAYVKSAEFTPPKSNEPHYDNGIVTTTMSLDGSVVVAADFNGNIYLFSTAGGVLTKQAEWALPASYCHMFDLAPDGSCFAAGGAAGTFYFFNCASFIATGLPTDTSTGASTGSVYGVAVAGNGSAYVGLMNKGSAGLAYLMKPGSPMTTMIMLQRNPNSGSLNIGHGLLAIADGHPDGTPGHYYLFSDAGIGSLPVPQWFFQTGNMSWPIVISAQGNAVVGGSDDSNIYYFTP